MPKKKEICLFGNFWTKYFFGPMFARNGLEERRGSHFYAKERSSLWHQFLNRHDLRHGAVFARGFPYFILLFYIFISRKCSFMTKSMHDTIHLRSYSFFKFSSMKWIIKQILLVLTTIKFDHQILVNSWIGNREVMDHDEIREDPEIIRSKQSIDIVFLFFYIYNSNIFNLEHSLDDYDEFSCWPQFLLIKSCSELFL